MGPCIRFLSFSAHVPMSSMAMKTSVCRDSSGCTPLPTREAQGPGEEMGGWGKPSSHVGDESPEALHNVGAVVALEHHVQIHEDPLVLLLIPRAPHLLHGTAEGSALSLGRRAAMGHGGGCAPMGRAGWAHLDSDDVPRLPEAHLPHLAASAAAHLPQVLQVVDLCLVALAKRVRAGDPAGL